MMDRELSERIGRSLLTFKLIWGAMLFSLVIYLFAGSYLSRSLAPGLSDPETLYVVRTVLYSLSLVTLAVTKFLRNRVLAKARESARTPTGEGGAAAQSAPVLASYGTAMILSLALSESIGIYGLVLSLLGSDTKDLFILIGVAAGAMVYYRPREDEVVSLVTGRTA